VLHRARAIIGDERRTDGRTDGRTGGRADVRTCGRTDESGRADGLTLHECADAGATACVTRPTKSKREAFAQPYCLLSITGGARGAYTRTHAHTRTHSHTRARARVHLIPFVPRARRAIVLAFSRRERERERERRAEGRRDSSRRFRADLALMSDLTRSRDGPRPFSSTPVERYTSAARGRTYPPPPFPPPSPPYSARRKSAEILGLIYRRRDRLFRRTV